MGPKRQLRAAVGSFFTASIALPTWGTHADNLSDEFNLVMLHHRTFIKHCLRLRQFKDDSSFSWKQMLVWALFVCPVGIVQW